MLLSSVLVPPVFLPRISPFCPSSYLLSIGGWSSEHPERGSYLLQSSIFVTNKKQQLLLSSIILSCRKPTAVIVIFLHHREVRPFFLGRPPTEAPQDAPADADGLSSQWIKRVESCKVRLRMEHARRPRWSLRVATSLVGLLRVPVANTEQVLAVAIGFYTSWKRLKTSASDFCALRINIAEAA